MTHLLSPVDQIIAFVFIIGFFSWWAYSEGLFRDLNHYFKEKYSEIDEEE